MLRYSEVCRGTYPESDVLSQTSMLIEKESLSDPAITQLMQNKLRIKPVKAIKAHMVPIYVLREVTHSCAAVLRLNKPLNHFFPLFLCNAVK